MNSEYVLILLLIAPGFVCRNIFAYLNKGCKNDDGWRLVLASLNYSVWILAVNYLVLFWRYGYNTFSKIQDRFNEVTFVLKYIGLTMFSCCLIALLLNLIYPYLAFKIINLIRKMLKRPPIVDQQPWELVQMLTVEKEKAVIYQGTTLIACGKVFQVGSSYEKRELVLEHDSELEKIVQNKKVTAVYVDCDNNLVIKAVK